MPAKRARDLSRIEDALAALQHALSELDAPWMVIGGIAVIAHGVQRMTTDIDAVIRGDAVRVRSLDRCRERSGNRASFAVPTSAGSARARGRWDRYRATSSEAQGGQAPAQQASAASKAVSSPPA
jgi:hypothetical protein